MAYTVDILNTKKVEANGLLSKIQIGGKTYEVKDVIARESIESISADLAALSYVQKDGVFESDTKIKEYVDAQVGSINKFDVVIGVAGDDGKPNVAASADTMYKLYLIQNVDSAAGEYVEYITIRSGEEGSYTYAWEAIGSTKMSLTGYVTETALQQTLVPYQLKSELGALAYKPSASGTVAGQTISGIKATGKSTGSITVEIEASDIPGGGIAQYTPTGSVSGGKVTAAGNVSVQFTQTSKDATLSRGDYIPEGSVSVVPTSGTVKAVGQVGTAASFVEGDFTPASLDYAEVTANYATEGLVGAVEGETLTFSLAGIQALSASKVNSFTGGSKTADTFTPNVPTSSTDANVVVGIGSASFEGTKVENLKVTGVSYMCHDSATATFTGTEVDVIGASFSGNESNINVTTNIKSYAVKTANFVPADIELSVGDIAVAEKNVTVQ